ncbi:MAG: DNA repair protein RadC [Candidatus Brocadiales bacterium]
MATSKRPSSSLSKNSHACRVYRLMAEKSSAGTSPQPDLSVSEKNSAATGYTKLENNPAARQMLHRIGLIKTPRDSRATGERIREITGDVSAASGDDVAVVEAVFAAYAGGPGAVCGLDTPRCEECVLTGLCRHFRRRPTIKELPLSERPRERLVAGGEDSLSDAELLGIIIRDGTPEASAVDLARKILVKYGNFRNLATKTISELTLIKGIGPAKAAQVKAATAIARRFAATPLASGARVRTSKDVFDHMHERLRDRRQETFLLLLLDSKSKIIKELQISAGSLSSSVVHPREVFAPAIRESAASVIFVHNHPSGDPTPSQNDLDITSRLKEVSDVVGIKVLDHVIIGSGSYVSLKDKGLM